ncbi:MAG: oligosaccharide flippase family protein, partial [Proteobacteria bacterium]|nr:oligosaccharide flippase family protein [Pseudomonadota bacterium]
TGVDYSLYFTLSLLINSLLFLVFNVMVILFGQIWGNHVVLTALHALSLTLFLSTPHHLRTTMLKRELDWKRFRILHLAGYLAGSAISIVMALKGFGVYALLAGNFIVPMPYIYDLFIREKWRPGWRLDWQAIRPAWYFGLTRIGSNLSRTGRGLGESALFVGQLGFGSYGLFTRGVSLSHLLCTKLPGQAMAALYPVLTKLEPGSERFNRAALTLLRFITWLVAPIAIIGSELAPALIQLVYGEKWLAVIPLMSWLFVLAFIGAVYEVIYLVLLANNSQRQCLYLDIGQTAITLVLLVLFLSAGAVAYIQGLVVGYFLVLLVAVAWSVRQANLSWLAVLKTVTEPLLGAGLAYLVLDWLAVRVWGQPGLLWDAAYVFIFFMTYLLVMRILFVQQLCALVNYFPFSMRIKQWMWL